MRNTISHVLLICMVLPLLAALSQSCSDDTRFASDSRHGLVFSTDTLDMDTVMAGVSSASYLITVYNRNDKAVRFDAMLAGGVSSPFNINVDGMPGPSMSGIEVYPGDSVMCLVNVNAPVSDNCRISVWDDSIRFLLESGAVQHVILRAESLNAIRLDGYEVVSDECFTADRPYLIYDTLHVAPGAELRLMPGAGLYFHNGAGLVVDGRIKAVGTPDSMIVFRGDRTDLLLSDLPYDLMDSQWEGIALGSGSFGNSMEYCDVHGGRFGIRADSSDCSELKLRLESSIVHNVAGNCIQADGCRMEISNSQLTNAGDCCVDIAGGRADFTFCTIASFSVWYQGRVAVSVTDRRGDSASVPFEGAYFNDCIITGRHNNELEVSDSLASRYSGLLRVSNSLVMASDTTCAYYDNVVFENRKSDCYGALNFTDSSRKGYASVFTLDSLSMARGIADTLSASFPIDLAGKPRPLSGADAGCFQSF